MAPKDGISVEENLYVGPKARKKQVALTSNPMIYCSSQSRQLVFYFTIFTAYE
jgi:hypothetical protein